jgi:hypothetical protein
MDREGEEVARHRESHAKNIHMQRRRMMKGTPRNRGSTRETGGGRIKDGTG